MGNHLARMLGGCTRHAWLRRIRRLTTGRMLEARMLRTWEMKMMPVATLHGSNHMQFPAEPGGVPSGGAFLDSSFCAREAEHQSRSGGGLLRRCPRARNR